MAKRNSMSAARRSRNRKQEPVLQSGTAAAVRGGEEPVLEPQSHGNSSDLAKVVRHERTRLIKAQAVLGCVAFALLYEDWLEEVNRPSFADAIAAVDDLVGETIGRLAPYQ